MLRCIVLASDVIQFFSLALIALSVLKNRAKARHRCKKHISTQNSVVYNCHFCSHWNLKRGTPKGHMKEMYPPKSIPKAVKCRLEKSITSSGKETSKDDLNEVDVISSPAIAAENPTTDGSMTPSVRCRTLLDGKKRNRNKSGYKRPVESENNPTTPGAEKTVGSSSKRMTKSWISLREIVESNEDNNSNTPNSKIPYLLQVVMIPQEIRIGGDLVIVDSRFILVIGY
ncbi:hypothetical protein CRYUN_Cryun12cG0046000 [Craigia yunnanensis]